MRLRLLFIAASLSFVCFSCKDSNYLQRNVDAFPPEEIKIKRYGRALFSLDTSDLFIGLQALKNDFPAFLDADLSDPSVINPLRAFVSDTFLIALAEETAKVFPGLDELEAELTVAMRYLNAYGLAGSTPAFYSYISGVDLQQPVIINDSMVLLALDCFLGDTSRFYPMLWIPEYRIRRMTAEYITRDFLLAWYQYYFQLEPKGFTILDEMVFRGKELLFIQAMYPEIPLDVLLGYTRQQSAWAFENEKRLWGFLLENELLFQSKPDIMRKLFTDGPFTADFGYDSPPRLGNFMGWRILSAYLKKEGTAALADLLQNTDANAILKASGYKPEK